MPVVTASRTVADAGFETVAKVATVGYRRVVALVGVAAGSNAANVKVLSYVGAQAFDELGQFTVNPGEVHKVVIESPGTAVEVQAVSAAAGATSDVSVSIYLE